MKAIFLKDELKAAQYPNRIIHKKSDYTNGLLDGETDFSKASAAPEEFRKISTLTQITGNTPS
jgi:hypothetical protein